MTDDYRWVGVYALPDPPTLDPAYPQGEDYKPLDLEGSSDIEEAIRRAVQGKFKYYILLPDSCDTKWVKMKEFDTKKELEDYLENIASGLSSDQVFIFYGQNMKFQRKVYVEPVGV